MKANNYNYDEGYSMGYVIHAVFLVVAAYLIGRYYLFPAIILGTIAVVLLFIKSGVDISISERYIRSYVSVFGFKFGDKVDFNKVESVELSYIRESQIMNSRGTSTNVRVRSHTLKLSSRDKDIKIHEFTDYKIAKKVCNQLEKSMNLVVKDEYSEIVKGADDYNKTH